MHFLKNFTFHPCLVLNKQNKMDFFCIIWSIIFAMELPTRIFLWKHCFVPLPLSAIRLLLWLPLEVSLHFQHCPQQVLQVLCLTMLMNPLTSSNPWKADICLMASPQFCFWFQIAQHQRNYIDLTEFSWSYSSTYSPDVLETKSIDWLPDFTRYTPVKNLVLVVILEAYMTGNGQMPFYKENVQL